LRVKITKVEPSLVADNLRVGFEIVNKGVSGFILVDRGKSEKKILKMVEKEAKKALEAEEKARLTKQATERLKKLEGRVLEI